MLQIIMCIMAAVLMCLSASYFLATMPAVILSVWILQKFYLRTSRQIRLLDLEAKSPLYSHFLESLNGLVTIRAFGWAESFQEKNLDLLDASQKPYYLMFCIQRWLALVLDIIVSLVYDLWRLPTLLAPCRIYALIQPFQNRSPRWRLS